MTSASTLRNQKKEKEIKPKTNIRKEIIKVSTEIKKKKQTQNRKTIEKFNKTKSWLFEKIINIEKPLAKLTKKKKRRTLITSIKNDRGDTTTDAIDIKKLFFNNKNNH